MSEIIQLYEWTLLTGNTPAGCTIRSSHSNPKILHFLPPSFHHVTVSCRSADGSYLPCSYRLSVLQKTFIETATRGSRNGSVAILETCTLLSSSPTLQHRRRVKERRTHLSIGTHPLCVNNHGYKLSKNTQL